MKEGRDRKEGSKGKQYKGREEWERKKEHKEEEKGRMREIYAKFNYYWIYDYADAPCRSVNWKVFW